MVPEIFFYNSSKVLQHEEIKLGEALEEAKGKKSYLRKTLARARVGQAPVTQALPTCHPERRAHPSNMVSPGPGGPSRTMSPLTHDPETPLVLHDNYTDKEAGVEEINQWHHTDFLGMELLNSCNTRLHSHLESR